MNMKVQADYREFIAQDAGLIAIMSLLAGAAPVLLQEFDRLIAIATSALCVFLLSILVIRYIMLVNVKWLIEEETLCRTRGIFSKERDYIEMYRITDYRESQTFLQRLLGVKTVTIYSTDRSDTVTDIFGVSADLDLTGIIRKYVEKCKKEKRIYEITNR